MGKHKSEEKLRKKIKRLQKRLIRKQKKLNHLKPVEESSSNLPEASTAADADGENMEGQGPPLENPIEMEDSSKEEDENSDTEETPETEEITQKFDEQPKTIPEEEKC